MRSSLGVLFEERDRAESFGAVADLYDRARPSYPPELVDALLADGAARVLDVGCGTGIAGALLGARGVSVLGVEIDERMARLARARGLEVEVAGSESWEPAGRRFDLVICGQAWHWIEPRAGVAKAAAVLAAGGRICVFWNLADPSAEFLERVAPIYERLAPDLESSVLIGRGRRARLEGARAALADSEHFTAEQTRFFQWRRRYDTEGWLEQLATHSDHLMLPAEQRQQLLRAIATEIGELGGSFEMTYQTALVSARRN
jgi:SAM-dependent methyltransferase